MAPFIAANIHKCALLKQLSTNQVGILLFNTITGLILNTFGALRQADNKRADILENTCFVNGITRAAYDDMALQGVPSFDHMNKIDQDPWNYVFFLYYLLQKNEMEYTGVDTFVKECYDKEKLIWIPNRMSFMMQNAMGGAGSKDDDSDKKPDPLVAMAANIEALSKQVGALVAWSGEVREKLGMD